MKVELLQKSTPSPGLYPLTITMTPLTTPTLVLPVTLDVVGVFCNDVDACLVAKQLRDRLLDQVRLVAYTVIVRGGEERGKEGERHSKVTDLHHKLTCFYKFLG